eukprot:gnl/TRDRNA2_/TRDRNA2_151032_c0_seq2.p1 gnl/TRDRNA2_/TRDRNA2_151032_c0~~gnl/TRDRNA2_/TRDRNA2_151032_c0_seq2.p1  ORF type:complete len:642 (+),score=97.32 gnl/TRDRNA2_/TRDRNA2_151032_c0_seq2:100-1926(+)
MAAAAVGNTISDIVGIYSGGLIEHVAEHYFDIREPPLSSDQRLLPATKTWQYFGQVIGITIGCILGMCPLLFIDAQEGSRLKRQKELETMLLEAMPNVKRIVRAEAVVLMAVDEEKGLLCNLSRTDNLPASFSMGLSEGVMGYVAKTSHFINTADVTKTVSYRPHLHDRFQGTDIRVKSILAMPMMRGEKVVGVLTAINKEHGAPFSTKDEDSLSFIASHIAVRMETLFDEQQSFNDVVLTCESHLNKQESLEHNSTSRQRREQLYKPALEGTCRVLKAQAVAIMLIDEEHGELYTEAIAGDLPKHKNKIGEGIASRCVMQGRTVNVDRRRSSSSGELGQVFESERHDNYLGSGTKVVSELCVPMYDSEQRCFGVLKCINKEGGAVFDTADEKFAQTIALDLAVTLEDDGGIKRVLARTRAALNESEVAMALSGSPQSPQPHDRRTVLVSLARGQSLPNNADACGVGIDPYVTIRIVQGNPLMNDSENVKEDALRLLREDKKQIVRTFGKSKTVMQNLNPQWNETIPVAVPIELRGVPDEDLYAHVLLWDYDCWKQHDLVGQASIPLSKVTYGKAGLPEPFHLQAVSGDDQYDLSPSRLWLSLSRPVA